VLELVMKAKKALIDSGLLAKDFSTAEEILERRKYLLKCTTGSSKLDSFLKGGIETQDAESREIKTYMIYFFVIHSCSHYKETLRP
jgi:Rad51